MSVNIINEDKEKISKSVFIDWKQLDNSNILVTGATGLIGNCLINGILEYSKCNNANIHVIALIRNEDKARAMFGNAIDEGSVELLKNDILEPVCYDGDIDYIIHGASETSSKAFVEQPVETIRTAIHGTENILELARKKNVKGMVYMSSMEVYGTPPDETPLTEEKMGYLNPLALRSSYSESKQMVENLCVAYQSEYNVPVKVIRLTQTFGPGVLKTDGRVFAQFARAAVSGEDIVLQTKGETKRMYLYTADAATAILTVLTKGEPGQAYNAANTDSYCSIKEMAVLVADSFGEGKSKVVINIPDIPNASYNPVMCVNMDVHKLEALGWRASTGLSEMYRRMICCMD